MIQRENNRGLGDKFKRKINQFTDNCQTYPISHTGTYHHGRIVPLLVGACSIRIDSVIDDLERCQADSLHGTEVGLPEPTGLWTNRRDFFIRVWDHEITDKNNEGAMKMNSAVQILKVICANIEFLLKCTRCIFIQLFKTPELKKVFLFCDWNTVLLFLLHKLPKHGKGHDIN